MKVGLIGPTLLVPEKTVIFFGVKPVVPSFILKIRKSHKKSARVYAYTHTYTQIRADGGKYNRVNARDKKVVLRKTSETALTKQTLINT